MTFTLNGNDIVQSGTDANLSGLEGINGVVRNGKTYYVAGNRRLIITGTLTIVGENNVLVMQDSANYYPRIVINNNAVFQVGYKNPQGNTITYSQATAIIIEGVTKVQYDTINDGGIASTTGTPTIKMYGGAIVTGKPISIGGSLTDTLDATVDIENTRLISTSFGHYRFDFSQNSTANIVNVMLQGDDNFFLFKEDFTFFSAVINNAKLLPFNGSDIPLRLDNLKFTNNQASYDFGYQYIEAMALVNCDKGSTLNIGPGGTGASKLGLYGSVKFITKDSNSNIITGVKYYAKDNNDGNRFPATTNFNNKFPVLSSLWETGNTGLGYSEYTGLSDINGEIEETVILSTYFRYATPSDYSNNGSFSDELNFNFVQYDKNITLNTTLFRTTGGVTSDIILLPDLNITESSSAIVSGYTELENSEKLYDFAKLSLVNNYKGEEETTIVRNGTLINARSYDVDIDPNAASVYDFDGSKITIKANTFTGDMTTTGTITLLNGAVFNGTRTDINGTISPPVLYTLELPNILNNSRVQIYNVTQATELNNYVVSGGNGVDKTYTLGTDFTAGDEGRIRVTYVNGIIAKAPIELNFTFPASTSTNSLPVTQQDFDIYNSMGIDGSTITKFTPNYVDTNVDLIVGNNFTGHEMYAWFYNNLTTEDGIKLFFDAVVPIDLANFEINTDLVDFKLDNTTTSNVYQTDTVRIYRKDGVYPVKDPTTGGGGIDIVWKDKIFIAETGVSGLTSQESNRLFDTSTKTDIDNSEERIKKKVVQSNLL